MTLFSSYAHQLDNILCLLRDDTGAVQSSQAQFPSLPLYSIHRVTVVRYIQRRPGLYIQINFRHRSFHRLISVAHAVALYDQSASQIFNGVDVIHLGGAAWRGAESQDEPVRRLYSRRRCSGGERAFVR